jgi:ubiquinone/menaquinone biosynthesis C-methylase UbiE
MHMKISRNLALKAHFILDECIPPIIRDQKWFIWLPFKILFKRRAKFFFEFKDKAIHLSEEEFAAVYEETSSVHIQRPTDLNDGCVKEIAANVLGESVLDVGCGRGFLAGALSEKHRVTACDMIVSEKTRRGHPDINFRQENMQRLSFADNEFDTVISSHTLEHVQDAHAALEELRRVAKCRLIVVLPKQRPYRYTFDLHLRFFPYSHTVLQFMRPTFHRVKYDLKEIEGDWYYQEDKIF